MLQTVPCEQACHERDLIPFTYHFLQWHYTLLYHSTLMYISLPCIITLPCTFGYIKRFGILRELLFVPSLWYNGLFGIGDICVLKGGSNKVEAIRISSRNNKAIVGRPCLHALYCPLRARKPWDRPKTIHMSFLIVPLYSLIPLYSHVHISSMYYHFSTYLQVYQKVWYIELLFCTITLVY